MKVESPLLPHHLEWTAGGAAELQESRKESYICALASLSRDAAVFCRPESSVHLAFDDVYHLQRAPCVNEKVVHCIQGLAERWVNELGYRELVTFHSTDETGAAVYHTNVMMAVGSDCAVVCAEAVPGEKERRHLMASLRRHHEVNGLNLNLDPSANIKSPTARWCAPRRCRTPRSGAACWPRCGGTASWVLTEHQWVNLLWYCHAHILLGRDGGLVHAYQPWSSPLAFCMPPAC